LSHGQFLSKTVRFWSISIIKKPDLLKNGTFFASNMIFYSS
jgi:hypothetical protein